MQFREVKNQLATHGKTLRRIVMAIGAVAVTVSWIATMTKARGDFLLHYEFGRRLVAGEFLYTNGMHLPYPPFWAMLFAPFSLFPVRVAMPLFFIIGFLSLAALLKILRELTRSHFALKGDAVFWVTAAVLFILSRFILRDLADGGENLFIVALSWGGIFFFVRKKPLSGGALLGLAIALKCTPLLFAGYFFLKRQWSSVASTLVFSALFFVSPMLLQGPASYMNHIKFWKDNVMAGVSQKDPRVGVLGPDELHNKALKPMLVRYLMELPPDHPGRFPGRAHIDFLRLPAQSANLVIKAIILGSFLCMVLLFSRTPAGTASVTLLWECAIISLLMLLYSPITWGQHCVAILPALYLIGLRFATGQKIALWIRWTTTVVVAVFLLLNRSIIGLTLSELAESYHILTICMLALVAVSVAFWNEGRKVPAGNSSSVKP